MIKIIIYVQTNMVILRIKDSKQSYIIIHPSRDDLKTTI